ncbi:DUF87 domain-containing protein [Bradyrhizobium barranii subsp. barranii]|uniref:DUF87 domain-containing protein n=1 Tax=Bradyrhizobium barranii subsp. barranii TaxID=2823807 RepID=A0A939M9C5_9BRAD|nr:DUF87 domain-containing protein [Bradyrhizobium barranii]UEM08627.1 DUF87 domain-containing protein [Bradyrhizobium barranii subsp. barranii]
MTFSFPPAVLEQHSAFLGKTGSGKTSTAKLAVEQILRDNPRARICVLDPIKSDWWGLTSSADGRAAGLPFYILGGPRGHVPLHESAGKAIGELVASGALPLSIIDMADFKHGGLQEFFNTFVPALMRHMRGVVHLVIEEAHEFAPKERAGIGAENLAIHNAKKLATAGRSKGIRMMVLTQRTQALHNAVLGSCDTMIAHRLTAPADQEPVKKWLKANVDKTTFESVSTTLSSLKTGSGWICSGEAQVAELRQFPKISTYDNSATPTGDMADQQVKTAAVDRERLRAIIGDAVKQVESDDPGHLRAEIARLNSRMANWAAHEDASADAIAAADRRGYERGFWEAASQAKVAYETLKEQVRGTVRGFADSLVQNIAAETIEFTQSGSPVAPPSASPSPRPAAVPTGRAPTPAASGDGSLPGPQQRILNSLATWRRLGHDKPSNAQIAWLAGYSPSSTSYTNPRSALKTGGLIDYPMADHLALTAAGVAKAVEFKLNGSLLDFVLGNLPGPEARILTSIAHHYPRAVPNATAAEGAQYSPSSTSYTNPRSALRTKDLIDYPEKDHVRAAEWLFAA